MLQQCGKQDLNWLAQVIGGQHFASIGPPVVA